MLTTAALSHQNSSGFGFKPPTKKQANRLRLPSQPSPVIVTSWLNTNISHPPNRIQKFLTKCVQGNEAQLWLRMKFKVLRYRWQLQISNRRGYIFSHAQSAPENGCPMQKVHKNIPDPAESMPKLYNCNMEQLKPVLLEKNHTVDMSFVDLAIELTHFEKFVFYPTKWNSKRFGCDKFTLLHGSQSA